VRTRVVHCDVRSPSPIFGLDGYRQLVLIVRDGDRVCGTLAHPLDGGVAALPSSDVGRIMSRLVPGAYRLRGPGAPSEDGREPPAVSVVVCTKDRPRALDRCLKALSGTRYPRYEVVVVDNASANDETAAVSARHGVRYAREDRPGLDRARNRGIREASHDVIAFVDDDVQVDCGWLTAVGRAFEDPSVDAVTGLVLPLELETAAQNYFETYGNGMSKGFEPRLFARDGLAVAQLIAVHHVGVGANMAARRSALSEVGGFDPCLDVGTPSGGAGDLDMFHRLLVARKRIRYEPLALAQHQHRRDMDGLTTQIYNNGRAFGVYLLKLLRDRTVPRIAVARYAAGTWSRWLLGRWVMGLLGRHALPKRLLWAEVRGALSAPLAFHTTYRAPWHGRGEEPSR